VRQCDKLEKSVIQGGLRKTCEAVSPQVSFGFCRIFDARDNLILGNLFSRIRYEMVFYSASLTDQYCC